MSIVVCKLPKAGLGNQLFPLLNAILFSKYNDLPLIITGYHHLKVGPYLRKEKIKRKYRGYFKFQKSIFAEQLDMLRVRRFQRKFTTVAEPLVAAIPKYERKGKIFLFEKLPRYHDYFIHLRDHRDDVKKALKETLNPWVLSRLAEMPKPVIGVHIRMGDFRKLKAGEDFSRVGHVRTPEDYFIRVIQGIRNINGKELPVKLFTDGYRHEFEQLFELPGIEMIEGNPDIIDLLLLSSSKIVVTANGSTFSYWAGFLSDAPMIKHPDHLYAPFRPVQVNTLFYEGPFNLSVPDPLLVKNIKALPGFHS